MLENTREIKLRTMQTTKCPSEEEQKTKQQREQQQKYIENMKKLYTR